LIDLNATPATQLNVIRQRIPIYLCPSESKDVARDQGAGKITYPLNYAANYGTWFIWDPTTGQNGDGALPVNRATRPADFDDGLSNTIGFAEVKAYQPYVRNTTSPTTMGCPIPRGRGGGSRLWRRPVRTAVRSGTPNGPTHHVTRAAFRSS